MICNISDLKTTPVISESTEQRDGFPFDANGRKDEEDEGRCRTEDCETQMDLAGDLLHMVCATDTKQRIIQMIEERCHENGYKQGPCLLHIMPAQHKFCGLRGLGLTPNILASTKALDENVERKLSQFSHVLEGNIVTHYDVQMSGTFLYY